jgi:hypothetical protein
MVLRAAMRVTERELFQAEHAAAGPARQPARGRAANAAAAEHDVVVIRLIHSRYQGIDKRRQQIRPGCILLGFARQPTGGTEAPG